MLYPMISDTYNSWLQSNAIAEYTEQVDMLEQAEYTAEIEKAHEYNKRLLERDNPYELTDELKEEYSHLLNMTSEGVMAYVEIPSIDVSLPIAHGTDDDTLRDKIGHLEWSSLPVGGENTHCVVSGHRGLPSSELFTNIDHLDIGDKFYIHVMGQTLEYQVCHIAVVEPDDQSLLLVEEKQDLVTLVTCTPYGINSHRLLVRGIRTGTQSVEASAQLPIKNETTGIDIVVLVSVVLVGVAVVAFIVMIVKNRGRKGGKNGEKTDNH